LGSFRTIAPRPTSLGPRLTRHRRELGLFCTFFPPGPRPTGRIGFVLHNWGDAPAAAGHEAGVPLPVCPQSATAQLGSFCTIAPCSHAPVAPSHPVPPEIGFVLLNPFPCPIHHNSFPAEDLPFVPLPGNWLCFARLLTRETRRTWRMKSKSCLARNPGPPLGSLCLCGETFEARRLGSFCIIYVRPAPPARGLPQDVAVKRQGNRRDIPVVRGICASPVVAGPSDGLLAAPVSCRLHSILVRHVRSVNII
jgi:hypothetical protein